MDEWRGGREAKWSAISWVIEGGRLCAATAIFRSIECSHCPASCCSLAASERRQACGVKSHVAAYLASGGVVVMMVVVSGCMCVCTYAVCT